MQWMNEWMNEGLKAHQHIRTIKKNSFVKWSFAIVEEQWQSMKLKKKRKKKSRAFKSIENQGIF